MATGFASALSEGQPAQLDLGEEAVPCLVVGFQGSDVMLAPGAELPPDAVGPRTIAYLLIEAGGMLHALKAAIRPIVLPAHLRPVGDTEEPWTTFTRDVSAGGLRVARQSGYREAGEHEVVLGLVQADREIRARAVEVRVTDTDVSLSFTDVEAEDRLLLAQLTFAYHRRGIKQ
jgi:hypothetical protein